MAMQRRIENRIRAQIPVEIVHSGSPQPRQLKTVDLSPRGAFISSDEKPPRDDVVLCNFDLPSDPYPYSFFGRVCYLKGFEEDKQEAETKKTAPPQERGFGVSFLDTTPIERLRLRSRLEDVQKTIRRTDVFKTQRLARLKKGLKALWRRLTDLNIS